MSQIAGSPLPELPTILSRLDSLQEIVRRRFKTKILGVFGSYARREQNVKSDLDILVHFEPDATLFDIVELEYFLEDELGIKPDIVSDMSIKPRIKPGILKDLVHI
ncbi:MAG: nucleotidyltransferase family protein [Saprospiraceae bacterium]|nr:nucleotidyltransferase family protein [Saprospiraceae bacterium]